MSQVVDENASCSQEKLNAEEMEAKRVCEKDRVLETYHQKTRVYDPVEGVESVVWRAADASRVPNVARTMFQSGQYTARMVGETSQISVPAFDVRFDFFGELLSNGTIIGIAYNKLWAHRKLGSGVECSGIL